MIHAPWSICCEAWELKEVGRSDENANVSGMFPLPLRCEGGSRGIYETYNSMDVPLSLLALSPPSLSITSAHS
jgi:hypothetical protein